MADDTHGSQRTAQIGLLLGFPEHAVRERIENDDDFVNNAYKLLRERIHITRSLIDRSGRPTGMDPQILEALEVLTGYNTILYPRLHEEILEARRVINRNRPYILRYVKDCLNENEVSATDEQIAYLVDRQIVEGYGFEWGGTPQDKDFLPTVIELFDKSGMTRMVDLSKQDVNNVVLDGLDQSETEAVLHQPGDLERTRETLAEIRLQAERLLTNPQIDIDPSQFDYVRRHGEPDHKASERMQEHPSLPKGQSITRSLQFHTLHGSDDTFTILKNVNGDLASIEMIQGETHIYSLRRRNDNSDYHTLYGIRLLPDGSYGMSAKQFGSDDRYRFYESRFYYQPGRDPSEMPVFFPQGEVTHTMSVDEIKGMLELMQTGNIDSQTMLRAVVKKRRAYPYLISEAEYQKSL